MEALVYLKFEFKFAVICITFFKHHICFFTFCASVILFLDALSLPMKSCLMPLWGFLDLVLYIYVCVYSVT